VTEPNPYLIRQYIRIRGILIIAVMMVACTGAVELSPKEGIKQDSGTVSPTVASGYPDATNDTAENTLKQEAACDIPLPGLGSNGTAGFDGLTPRDDGLSTPGLGIPISQLPEDLVKPDVTLVEPSRRIINRSNIGEDIDVVISFSEPMDTDEPPRVSFDMATRPAMESCNGTWNDPETYNYSCSISGAPVESSSTIGVSGAKDLRGNIQSPYALSGAFKVDTRAPKVRDVGVSTPLIDRGYIGSSLKFSVTFLEKMDAMTAPKIGFDPEAMGALLACGGIWKNTTLYQYDCRVFDTQIVTTSGINVSGAEDAAGNIMADYAEPAAFRIDTLKNFSINLKPGWNMVSLQGYPLDNESRKISYTAESFSRQVKADILTVWDPESQKYIAHNPGTPDADITLEEGSSFLVHTPKGKNLTQRGVASTNVCKKMVPGWNAVGIPAIDPVSADSILNSIDGADVAAGFSSTYGWKLHKTGETSTDFTVSPGDGLLVHTIRSSTWNYPPLQIPEESAP
jgi:hypothetical protein